MSRKSLRFLLPVGLGLILLSQFNNCDNFSSANMDTMLNSQCVGSNCYVQLTSEDLALEIAAGSTFGIPANIQVFDLGGYCDEAGFPKNKILWELSYSNFVVISSKNFSLAAQPAPCVDGRFQIRVDLGSNRIGLINPLNSNIRTPFNLDIEVIGIDSKNAEHRNSMNARKRIILNPVP